MQKGDLTMQIEKKQIFTSKQILKRYFMTFLGLIFLLTIDQTTKWFAAKNLKDSLSIKFIPNLLNFQYIENRGAAFGILQNSRFFFLILTIIITLASIYIIGKIIGFPKFNLLLLSLTVFLAGAIGNFIDRLLRHYVIDFLEFDFINFPIFNMADIYVTLSLMIFVILMFFVYKDKDFDGILFPKKERK